MKITSTGLSRVGGRERNEDRFEITRCGSVEAFILADGSGGHGAGDEAAQRAVTTVERALPRHATVSARSVGTLLMLAHEAVLEGQRVVSSGRDMHATLVLLLLDGARGLAAWGHVGDSRLYHLRGGALMGHTRDHSVVQTLMDAGFISAAQAVDHPNRSQLLAALGSDEAPEPSLAGPLPVGPGDAFLLCSDGWWESLDDAAIVDSLAANATPDAWLADMELRLTSRPRRHRDNYTAIAVTLDGDGEESTRILVPKR